MDCDICSECKDHAGFVERMKKNGYTTRQIKRLVEFYIRSQNVR